MNKFQFLIANVFKKFKRTLSLMLSYFGSIGLMIFAAAFFTDPPEDEAGILILIIFFIIIFIIGLIAFIDTIIYQAKSY